MRPTLIVNAGRKARPSCALPQPSDNYGRAAVQSTSWPRCLPLYPADAHVSLFGSSLRSVWRLSCAIALFLSVRCALPVHGRGVKARLNEEEEGRNDTAAKRPPPLTRIGCTAVACSPHKAPRPRGGGCDRGGWQPSDCVVSCYWLSRERCCWIWRTKRSPKSWTNGSSSSMTASNSTRAKCARCARR